MRVKLREFARWDRGFSIRMPMNKRQGQAPKVYSFSIHELASFKLAFPDLNLTRMPVGATHMQMTGKPRLPFPQIVMRVISVVQLLIPRWFE
jgi:hypothetical protein